MSRKRIIKPEGWTTENEISYLQNIGGWFAVITHSRKEILQGYIDSALRRDDWGEVDRDTVRSYALEMLRDL